MISSHTPPLAVLWDNDGTMVDTEPVWIQTVLDILADHGIKKSYTDITNFTGLSAHEAGIALVELIGDPSIDPDEISALRSDMVAERLAASPPPWRPGAKKLLEELYQSGIPCALVSSSLQPVLDAGLNQLPADWFEVVVTGADVEMNKPAPDCYLLAAQRLGVDITQTLVLEDSLVGAAAGRASGAVVLGVPNQRPLTQEPGQVNLDTLEGVDLAELRRIWAQGHEELVNHG